MHGDFTLDPLKYRDDVTRVMTQQGRVQLDSDANEQTETILRFLRSLGRDLIGPHGGPGTSFQLTKQANELHINRGEYYVDGIRCSLPPGGDIWEIVDDPAKADLRKPVSLKKLPNFVPPDDDDANTQLIYYLDVWERHVSSSEDDSLREVALLGADTSSRALLTWRLRTIVLDDELRKLKDRAHGFGWPFRPNDDWYAALNLRLRTGVRMRARAIGSESTNPCIIAPDARYRGFENRLFRVEIHDAGIPAVPGSQIPERKPTFKWSHDNGSIVYPVRKISGKIVRLASLGRDARTQICVNDWVEVVDDDQVINPKFYPLLQVVDVNPADMTVELNAPPEAPLGTDPNKHPILRRWASNLIELELRAAPKDGWSELADGVQIEFSRLQRPYAGLRPGDYWLIPTRTADGSVAWPQDNGVARDLPPNGVDHHYAPIAMMDGPQATPMDLRLKYLYLAL